MKGNEKGGGMSRKGSEKGSGRSRKGSENEEEGRGIKGSGKVVEGKAVVAPNRSGWAPVRTIGLAAWRRLVLVRSNAVYILRVGWRAIQ